MSEQELSLHCKLLGQHILPKFRLQTCTQTYLYFHIKNHCHQRQLCQNLWLQTSCFRANYSIIIRKHIFIWFDIQVSSGNVFFSLHAKNSFNEASTLWSIGHLSKTANLMTSMIVEMYRPLSFQLTVYFNDKDCRKLRYKKCIEKHFTHHCMPLDFYWFYQS